MQVNKTLMYKFYIQTKWWVTLLFPFFLETFIHLGSLHRFIENRKKNFFASPKFHRLRNFFYAHMAIHKRSLKLLKNSGCYLKRDMLGDFYVTILSEELLLILIIVIWLSSCVIFCNFLKSFFYHVAHDTNLFSL